MANNVFYSKNKKYNCVVDGKPYFRKTATIDGKRRNFYGDGEKDANRKIEEAKQIVASGLDYDKRTTKLGEAIRYWLFNVKRIDKDLKASTFSRYEMIFRLHIKPYTICNMPLSKINFTHLQNYITSLDEQYHLTGPTIKAVFKLLRMFMKWAMTEDYIGKDPTTSIKLPGKREKGQAVLIETFTDEERNKIFKYMEDTKYEYDTLIRLAFATGMRQGELLGLQWDDIYDGAIHVKRSTGIVTHVDKDGNKERYREIWDTKTVNSVRTIPILPAIQTMLDEHKRTQTIYLLQQGIRTKNVFTTKGGELIDQANLRRSYQRLLKRSGVPYRKFHAIRHTFATEAIKHGVPVKDVQLLMGHGDIHTTYIYVQPNEESQRKAIELIGLLM